MSVFEDVRDLHPEWTARFNQRDIDGMLAIADSRQIFVSAPGTTVEGDDAKSALEHFLALELPIETRVRHVYVMDDIALLIVDWSITGEGPDGSAVSLSGTTADVARKGSNGWKIIIDNPYGTA